MTSTAGNRLQSPIAPVARCARVAGVVLLCAQVTACVLSGAWVEDLPNAPESTYRKFLARAETGDAESQNVVGFMLFHGEGVRMDRDRAQMWFQRAAEQGHENAQRNQASMNALGALQLSGTDPATGPVRANSQLPSPGEMLYQKFCGGCHGFNGISAYVHSPSFALGESLNKSDAELLRSLMRGKGEMPNWDDKLAIGQLEDVLRFVRSLQTRYDAGIMQALRGSPPVYYLFGPMAPDYETSRRIDRSQGRVLPRTD